MATEDDGTKPEEESGGALRKKLETALAENATVKSQLATLTAQNLIREKGYKLITVEDLKEVGIEDLPARAETLEKERATLGESVLRQTFEAKGLTGQALEEAMTAVLGQSDSDASLSALDRIRSVGSVQGTPVTFTDSKDLDGAGQIKAALAANRK